MNIAVSICKHEIEMARKWFDWIIELGGTDGHNLFLIPSAGMNVTDIIAKANRAFGGRVTIIQDAEGMESDWQNTEPLRSASGPNSSFRQVAWHFYLNKLGPYFWCELDCIPLKKDWLTQLEKEYATCGKPFMGAHVLIENVPEHLSGNAIYVDVPQEAPTLVMRTEWIPRGQEQSFELAFDIAGAAETVPKSHWTKLIQHKFRYEGFKTREQFDEVIDPSAVVFHSCKDGSIFPYLRETMDFYRAAENVGGIKGLLSKTITDDQGQPIEGRLVNISSAEKTVPPAGAADNGEVTPDRTYSYSEILERAVEQPSGLSPISEPWKNKAESEREVRLLCSALALFAKTPVYKHRVREALREAKIIK